MRSVASLTLSNQDLRHRLSNLIAVVSSLVSLSARGRPEAQPFAHDLIARLGVLASVGQIETEAGEHDLAALIGRVLAAHADAGERVAVAVEPLKLSASSATVVALILNELVSNAARHGALSSADGRVRLEGGRTGDQAYRFAWSEAGGPVVHGPPQSVGAGTLLIERLASQLQAKLDRGWMREGLRFALEAPVARLEA